MLNFYVGAVDYWYIVNPFAEVLMRMVLTIKFWAISFAFDAFHLEN